MDKLVSTDWLAARLDAEDIAVLDASMHLPESGRDARAEYEAGHIPGARFLDLATFIDETSGVPKAVPTPEQFAARMGELGVAPRSRIVIYDDSAIRSAARAWFVLSLYGQDNVAILDGGLAKWRAEGRELASGTLEQAPREWGVPQRHREVRSKDDMLENIDSGNEQVVDARDAARFAGEEGSGSAGHIPGSRNLHFGGLIEADGTYKSPDAIAAEFAAAGVDTDAPIVTSCNSGVTAAVLLFGLALLGKDSGALYDGSWMEWGGDPATPKESGIAR